MNNYSVEEDDSFNLFANFPMTSATANALSNITHSINNESLNETQRLNKRAKIDETINKIADITSKKNTNFINKLRRSEG